MELSRQSEAGVKAMVERRNRQTTKMASRKAPMTVPGGAKTDDWIHESQVRSTLSHAEILRVSTDLTLLNRRMFQPMATLVTPQGVIDALNRAGVRPVLMGTYGLAGWRGQSRATQDVDVLVRKKDVRKAMKCLQEAFPTLVVKDMEVVARFTDPEIGEVVLDLMKPTDELYKLVFRYTIPVGQTHDIPDLEMALVSKFAAMISPLRLPEKRLVDAGDFMRMVRINRQAIDLPKLYRLADRVYLQGSAEMASLIRDTDAGRTIQL